MFIFSVVIVVIISIAQCQKHSPVVQTNCGLVQGKILKTALGKDFYAYLGIPYAEPPLGNLRFKRTLPVRPWNGIFNATQHSSACFQKYLPLGKIHPEFIPFTPTTELSEDCLTLSIWVPKNKPARTAVMVFIYGGGHAMGATSSPLYDGSILATEERVIVITMNYRLASLGFLFLDHPDVPGNAGLYDQNMALRWIKANIEEFGGDSDSITLFGYSSGAACVGHHILSPISWGIFNRAILQSASPTAEWNVLDAEEAVEKAMYLVDNLECVNGKSNLSAIVDCLQTSPADEIISSEFVRGFAYYYIHGPVVDGVIVPDKPKKLLEEKRFVNVSVMSGSVKDDGSIFLLLLNPVVYSSSRDNITITIEEISRIIKSQNIDDLTASVIKAIYVDSSANNDGVPSSKNVQAIVNIASDYAFHCPVSEFESYYSSAGNDIFKYLFTYSASVRKSPAWMGTNHGNDIYFVLGDPLKKYQNYTKDEEILSRRMMRYWANFARTGDPNNCTSATENENIYWPRYTSTEPLHLILAPNSSAVGIAFRENICDFWINVKPHLKRLATKLGPNTKNDEKKIR